ncbi:hypothetical protein [Mucisphaera calidilacus]|uniref:PEP-CTERM protein-sorting domain-containing protein n=1 Tax=Mucisphaera calidilacus TaxID=2527982 RepID=A0A518BWJ0_9BACT|nr:hypothetical protein [Mucisphaera calidilacus]QDU71294.1 hypothetical protein Pan265_11430 [Mucisphaera calidilacus]
MFKHLVALFAALIAAPALADNFAPPPYVGQPLSYHAEWDFGNPNDISAPDKESNGGPIDNEFLYDRFATHIDYDGDGWVHVDADGDGGIANPGRPGSFGINTINWVDTLPLKLIRVQITHIGPAPDVRGAEGISYDPYHGGSTLDSTSHGFFPSDPPVVVDPNRFYQDITMWPNPDWEQIIVDVPQGTVIDQIVVDSISIPEPLASTCLMLAAALLLPRER